MDFLIGLILVLTGFGVMHFRFRIYDLTGEWSLASQYLGGTMNAIVLIGMLLIGSGIAYPFGAFDGLSAQPKIEIQGEQR